MLGLVGKREGKRACGTYGRHWRCLQGLVRKREGKRELVARMGDIGGACSVWWGNVRERDRL